jgi:hypothetical protein
MPVGPMLMKLRCPQCSWKTFYKTPGCVAIPTPLSKWARLPKSCPLCGNMELTSEATSFFDYINPISHIKAIF